MIRLLIFLTLLSTALAQPGQFIVDKEKPDAILGYVNGKPITQSQFQYIILSSDPGVRDALKNKPEEFLRYYGFMDKLMDLAIKNQINLKEPYRTRLMMVTNQILSEAAMQEHEYADVVSQTDQEEYFKTHIDKYSEARVKLIYISFSDTVTELKARQKIIELAARAKKGDDFVELVKEFSEDEESKKKDGDFVIKKSDGIPDHIKTAVFALKNGQTTEPIKLPNGYYLFHLKELSVKSYKDVKDEIFTEIKQERKSAWLNTIRSSVDVRAPETVKGK